ncbi:hypothetical protein Taro_023964 [Colocasia esculenta]|uniref:BHLH domain-containing protein n=1 Tax=Colocasia esculenta TaxID=4460 RepID=A0A843VG18_COLES|nr:hypothetical protein [Colocasia esculenta]
MFHRVELEIQNSFPRSFSFSLTLEPSSPLKNLDMEPSELDHHHHQQQREHLQGFAAVAAPPASTPLHVGSNHAWKYSTLLLKGEDSTTPKGGRGLPSFPIDPKQGYEALLPPPLGTSMVHDLGLHWPCTSTADTYQGQFSRAEEELPDSFLKLARFGAAVWNSGEHQSSSTGKYEQQVLSPDVDVGLLSHNTDSFQLPTRASHEDLPSASSSSFGGGAATAFERLGSYTKMLLATNTPYSSSFPGSFSMQELQALDLLASSRFGAQMTLRQPSLGNVAFFGEGVACGMGHLPSTSQGGPSKEPQKISSLLDGVKEGKRSNGGPDQYKASPAPVAKKARPEPRSSTSPLKVRKEKLGDRVAALQQLVAPFGKTDTASVLTEAVGYIKFLQEQVQTLSMPYLRSSGKNKIRTAQGVPSEEKDETKQDLRSRGLCLVPLSYTSYFTSESGSAWSPSYFRGA